MKIRNTTKTNILFFMIIFTTIITQLVFSFAYSIVLQTTTNETILMIADELSLVVIQIMLMIPALIYVCVFKPETINDIKFRMVGGRQMLLILLVLVLLIPIISFLNLISSIGVESAGETISGVFANMPFWKAFLYVAVIPGICEEVLCRGFLYHGLRRRNKFLAIILSSVMFGLIHMNINQFVYAVALGIILALVVEITGTLWSSIFIHLAYNGINVAMAYAPMYLEKYINTEAEIETVPLDPVVNVTQYIYSVILMAGMAVVAACLMILVLRLLAKVSGAMDNVRDIFSKEGRKTYHEEGRFIDIYFIMGLVPAIGFILVIEVLTRVSALITG